jgi:hypothetical protein
MGGRKWRGDTSLGNRGEGGLDPGIYTGTTSGVSPMPSGLLSLSLLHQIVVVVVAVVVVVGPLFVDGEAVWAISRVVSARGSEAVVFR